MYVIQQMQEIINPANANNFTDRQKLSVEHIVEKSGIILEGDEVTSFNKVWADFCLLCNEGHNDGINGRKRPMMILDGQHRTRGTQSGASADLEEAAWFCPLNDHEEPAGCDCRDNLPEDSDLLLPPSHHLIPFTLLPPQHYDRPRQGKIFTDITTQAEPLDPAHQLYMLYRYGLQRPITRWDSNRLYDFDDPESTDSLCYQTVMNLISSEFGPLRNRIPPIGGKQEAYWANSVRHFHNNLVSIWDRVFSDYTTAAHLDQVRQTLDRYFEAIGTVFDGENPDADQSPRYWSDSYLEAGAISGSGDGKAKKADGNLWFNALTLLIPDVLWEAQAARFFSEDANTLTTFKGYCGNYQENMDNRFELFSQNACKPHDIEADQMISVLQRLADHHPFQGDEYSHPYWTKEPEKLAKYLRHEIHNYQGLLSPTGLPCNPLDIQCLVMEV
jgi:hypothetical protein